jgi:hypothetical protein
MRNGKECFGADRTGRKRRGFEMRIIARPLLPSRRLSTASWPCLPIPNKKGVIMEQYNLEFKWGVSRARDTEGYTICSLYVNGYKKASCNGGGYDMRGTVLGDWIASRFADELVKVSPPMSRRNGQEVQEFYGLTFHDPNYNPGAAVIDGVTVAEREFQGKSLGLERYQAFYSASSNVPTEKHTVPRIDGACGMSSVEKIVQAIGFRLLFVSQSNKLDVYTMIRA